MKTYLRLAAYVKPFLFLLIIGVTFTAIQSGINVYYMPMLQDFMDNMSKNLSQEDLLHLSYKFGACVISASVLRYFGDYIFYYISNHMTRGIRQNSYNKVLQMPIAYFEKMTSGHLLQRIAGDTATMQRGVTVLCRDFVSAGIKIVGFLWFLFTLNWIWTSCLLVCGPLLVLPMSKISKKIKRYSKEALNLGGDIGGASIEMFEGIRVIKGYGLEASQRSRYEKLNIEQCNVTMKSIKYSELPRPISSILLGSVLCAVLYYSGMEVIEGKMTFADFMAFIIAGAALQGPVKNLGNLFGKLQESVTASERVFELIDTDSEFDKQTDAEDGPVIFDKKIEFKDVDFTYPGTEAQVLKSVSFTLNKGETVALVGGSGAGKTTLADLLSRFYEIEKGTLAIDGVSVADIHVSKLRSLIALVNQHTFLFDDTVLNNIACGSADDVAQEEIEAAARAAEAHDFIVKMEDGYDTRIGEKGLRLSGGQRQRLAIARALVRNAPILILDEATSSLDAESERLVQAALERLKSDRTVLVIAHRLSTIKNADKIIVMDSGQVVASGKHEELLQQSPVYMKLCKNQGLLAE